MSSYIVTTLNDGGPGSLREGILYSNSRSSSSSHCTLCNTTTNTFNYEKTCGQTNSSFSSSSSTSTSTSTSTTTSSYTSSSCLSCKTYSTTNDETNILEPMVITFEVSGKIKLKSDLPIIKKPLIIDANIIDEIPQIEISGEEKYNTMIISDTENCIINGLSLTNSAGSGILIKNSENIEIYNCWIGLNLSGYPSANSKNGISIVNSCWITIGDNPLNNQEHISNTISANKKSGILVLNSEYVLIRSNVIGLNVGGTDVGYLTNSDSNSNSNSNTNSYFDEPSYSNGLDGISIINSNSNTIGGKIFIDSDLNANNPTGDKGTIPPVFVRPLLGNIISGNKLNGVRILNSSNNDLNGNFIGTDITGCIGIGNRASGIYISDSEFTNIVGADFTNNPFVFYNVISGNVDAGIYNYKSKYTLIQANFVGIGANNLTGVPNGIGIFDKKSSNTIVGGVIPLGNVVSGNLTYGFYVTTGSEGFVSINTFCGLAAFGGAVPNGSTGFMFNSDATNIKVNTNVISGNQGNGIEFADNVSSIILTSNIIGLNTEGNSELPNLMSGVVIGGKVHDLNTNIQITSVIQKNIISSNEFYGMVIKDEAYNNVITQLNLGLNYFGLEQFTNKKGGLLITGKANNNVIGLGVELDAFNYICDKDNFAIKLNSNTYSNRVTNNFINIDTAYHAVPHIENIVNLSTQNVVSANNLPYEELL